MEKEYEKGFTALRLQSSVMALVPAPRAFKLIDLISGSPSNDLTLHSDTYIWP